MDLVTGLAIAIVHFGEQVAGVAQVVEQLSVVTVSIVADQPLGVPERERLEAQQADFSISHARVVVLAYLELATL